ncbi:MAG: peptidoglycan editing factor PgeF [Pelagibacterales bacterium]|nr:peptidoglycan editing factor PgeF [Pelagibacterales bacterium]
MNIKFNFFGKDCLIDRALQNRSDLICALKQKNIPNQKVLFVNQIHSNEVVVIDKEEKIYGDQNLPKADSIVTNLANIVIGVVTADCSPILLYDENNNIVAATHAGWRGAKIDIIANTVNQMKKLGAKNIIAEIGPMIQQESYQVSQEFLDDFLVEDAANKIFFNKDDIEGKYIFDLPSYVEKKLSNSGVAKINNSKIDTYKNDKTYFSFRRSTHLLEKDCGRNISVISIVK